MLGTEQTLLMFSKWVCFLPSLLHVCVVVLFDLSNDYVSVLQNKLQDLTGKHTNLLENLSPNVRKRVEVLREIQACLAYTILLLEYV